MVSSGPCDASGVTSRGLPQPCISPDIQRQGIVVILLLYSLHKGDLLLRIEEALYFRARLNALKYIRAAAAILHGFLATEVVILVLLTGERLQHKCIAIRLHLTAVILETTIVEPHKNLFFHWKYLHTFRGNVHPLKIKTAGSVKIRLSNFNIKLAGD